MNAACVAILALCCLGAGAPAEDGIPDAGRFRCRLDGTETVPAKAGDGWSLGPSVRLRGKRTDYPDFAAAEWQPRLANQAANPSGLLSDLRSAELAWPHDPGFAPLLRHAEGSDAKPTDFRPMATVLAEGAAFGLGSASGRSSEGAMPYFNLRLGESRGVMLAVGWTGDWKATFARSGGQVRFSAGIAHAHFRLAPGEEVRLPSVLAMPYRGDWLDGQNRFRRLMRRHFTPAAAKDGAALPVAASPYVMFGFNDQDDAKLLGFAAKVRNARQPVDTLWVDAGWNAGGFPAGQGNPEPDAKRFPRGLRPLADAAHADGKRLLTWFEPERVMPGSWLAKAHPEWLLAPAGLPPALRYQADWRLFDLGNPAARAWATATVSRQLSQWRVDIYRQDFNMHPRHYWRAGEPAGRQGIREIRHVEGLYAFWDDLQKTHPGLLIDGCASGGRRLDFEMMRRSAALWRSDHCWDQPEYPRAMQAMHYGLSLWHPFTGVGCIAPEPLPFRTGVGSHVSLALRWGDPGVTAAAGKRLAEFLPHRSRFAEDFYPLTEWNLDEAAWIGWQCHSPGDGGGVVQLFRRRAAAAVTVRLRGLEPAAQYRIAFADGSAETATGAALAAGWTVRDAGSGAPFASYRKLP